VDTKTALTDAESGNNVRSAASTNGGALWISGTGTGSSPGVRYATRGATTSTQLSTTDTNLRQVEIVNGQLYVSGQKSTTFRVGSVGSGAPTTSGQTISDLPGLTAGITPNGFFFANLSGGPSLDTLYVADDTTGGGQIQKYSLVSGSWVASGTITAASARGVTGIVSGSTVTLYGTTDGTIYSYVDSSGYNGSVSGTASTLVSAPANEAFRGITLAPTP
jgi:hypothetical protein